MDKKKIIIVVICILIIACVGFYAYQKINVPTGFHDGTTGEITFEKLSKSPIGYGVEFVAGEVPFDINLTKGTLKLEILRSGNIVFEEEFDASGSEIINIPEDGLYLIQISGKKCTGKIKYEVSNVEESKVTDDDVLSLVENTNVDSAKDAVLKYLKETFTEDVEDIKITDFKLYTEKEMKEDEILKEAFDNGKFAFDVSYEIELTDGADGMQYTAATGELEGNVVKGKSNVGYLIEKNGKFEVEKESFGTGF